MLVARKFFFFFVHDLNETERGVMTRKRQGAFCDYLFICSLRVCTCVHDMHEAERVNCGAKSERATASAVIFVFFL